MWDMGRGETAGPDSAAENSWARGLVTGTGVEQGEREEMRILNKTAKSMGEAIRDLPGDELAAIQRSLRQLSLVQFDFVYDILENEVIGGRMTRNDSRCFETFMDDWWTHVLPMKLAFLSRVVTFTDHREWPLDLFPELQTLPFPYGSMPCREVVG